METASLAQPLSTRTKPVRSANGFVSSVWEFPPRQDVAYAAHSVYRWYGTLPGPLVGRLLDLYAPPGTAVWDPMCGAGTTLVEARLRGLRATGVDVNPLACLVALSKLSPIADVTADTAMALERISARMDDGQELVSQLDPSFDYAKKWFSGPALGRLLSVGKAIGELGADPDVERTLFVALASITRDVAQVDARCTHHLVRKRKPDADALTLLKKRATANAMAYGQIPAVSPDLDRQIVQQADFLELPDRKAGLVIAHPPYLGVINYHLVHRLATEVLRFVKATTAAPTLDEFDFDPEAVKSGDASTDSDQRYAAFLDRMVASLSEATASGGRCAVVIGDSRHKGFLRHPFTDIVARAEDNGMRVEETFIWLLQNNGGMHVRRRGHHIDHNYILILRRPE